MAVEAHRKKTQLTSMIERELKSTTGAALFQRGMVRSWEPVETSLTVEGGQVVGSHLSGMRGRRFSVPLLSENDALRRRVAGMRRKNFTFQKAQDLVMATYDPGHSVAVIESMLSPVQAGLLKGFVQGRENELLRRRVRQLRESCKTSK